MNENVFEYKNDFYENIKKQKSSIYRNFNSKKRFKMYFENLRGREKKAYMEEQNLNEININTINFTGIKALPLETQKFIFDEWISKYEDSDTSIAKNTKLARYQLQHVRQIIGYPPSRGRVYSGNKKKPTKQKIDNVIEAMAVKAKNDFSISLDLVCGSEDIRSKIEAVGILLNPNKNYELVLKIKEI